MKSCSPKTVENVYDKPDMSATKCGKKLYQIVHSLNFNCRPNQQAPVGMRSMNLVYSGLFFYFMLNILCYVAMVLTNLANMLMLFNFNGNYSLISTRKMFRNTIKYFWTFSLGI